ncbi:uncharacterized protein LOC144942123 isoform X2 [Lampetra fluviatilis]
MTRRCKEPKTSGNTALWAVPVIDGKVTMTTPPQRLRVAVVGAGAAGLCTARHILDSPADFVAPVVFEMDSVVGGTWVYKELPPESDASCPVFSSLYRDLRTNLPKEVMAFPDFPFDKNLPSFIHHSDMRAYLDQYADHFSIQPHVKFQWRVELVQPVPGPAGTEDSVAWDVTACSLTDGHRTTQRYDAVMVCNGHDYRSAEWFAGRRVALLGAGASGQDIAVELSGMASYVLLCHRGAKPLPSALPPNVQQAPAVLALTESGVALADGTERAVDAFVFCTGYRYSFPFLAEEAGVCTGDDERTVVPLYRHLVHVAMPTMFFIGLCKVVVPFPLFDCQVRFSLATLVGRASLPSRGEMEEEARREREQRRAAGVPERRELVLGERQWGYMAELVRLAGAPHMAPCVREIYDDVAKRRSLDLLAYRSVNYEVTGPECWCLLPGDGGRRDGAKGNSGR